MSLRIRHRHPALPRTWLGHPAGGEIVAERDIKLTPDSRLAAKLLVFRTPRALTAFWREALNIRMNRGALGAVNALASEILCNGVPMFLEVDPRYFCVIGLTLGNLSMECISHESVHAGFAFANRHRRDFWVPQSSDYCEEDVAYPAGRIAKRINAFLHDEGLYAK